MRKLEAFCRFSYRFSCFALLTAVADVELREKYPLMVVFVIIGTFALLGLYVVERGKQ